MHSCLQVGPAVLQNAEFDLIRDLITHAFALAADIGCHQLSKEKPALRLP